MNPDQHFKAITRDRLLESMDRDNGPYGLDIAVFSCCMCRSEITTDLIWITENGAYCTKCRRH